MRATPELEAAVRDADAAFERHLEPAGDLCISCMKEDRAPFEEALRPFRARRLELPVSSLASFPMGHGSPLVHGSPSRLRWFVPSFLAEALRAPDRFASVLRLLAEQLREARRVGVGLDAEQPVERVLRAEERAALARFLELALDRAVRGHEGHGASDLEEASAVLDVAQAAVLDAEALARTWLVACDEDAAAANSLLRAVDLAARHGRPTGEAPEDALRAVLARETVRAWLERAFFAATAAEARARFSEAEEALSGLM